MTVVLVAHIIWGITCEVVLLRLLKCKTTAAGVVVVPFWGYLTLRSYTNERGHLFVNGIEKINSPSSTLNYGSVMHISHKVGECDKFLLVESGILGLGGIRNTVQGIRNPTNDWNPESKFH